MHDDGPFQSPTTTNAHRLPAVYDNRCAPRADAGEIADVDAAAALLEHLHTETDLLFCVHVRAIVRAEQHDTASHSPTPP